MTSETQAAELPRQDDAFQAAVDVTRTDIMNLMDTVETRGTAELELERALWDFAATWTVLLQEHSNPEQLEEQAQP